MNLIEKLNKHLDNIREGYSSLEVYSSGKRKNILVHVNPSANELISIFKENRPDGLRGLTFKNNWYFWNAYDALHEEVGKTIGIHSAMELIPNEFELTNHNTIHTDHWDKIQELAQEADRDEARLVVAKHLKTLKELNRIYHTKIPNLKEWAISILKIINGESGPTQYDRLNKQQRHEYRKARYERSNKLSDSLADLFNRF